MAISQFKRIYLRRVDFRKLNLSFRSDPNELNSPSQRKFLDSRRKSVIDDNSVGVKGSPHNAGIELAPPFLHRSDQIHNGQPFVVFELLQHFADGQILLVNVTDFDELRELAAREQEIVSLPNLLFLPDRHLRHLQFVLLLILISILLFLFRLLPFDLPIWLLLLLSILIILNLNILLIIFILVHSPRQSVQCLCNFMLYF